MGTFPVDLNAASDSLACDWKPTEHPSLVLRDLGRPWNPVLLVSKVRVEGVFLQLFSPGGQPGAVHSRVVLKTNRPNPEQPSSSWDSSCSGMLFICGPEKIIKGQG